MFQGCGCSRRPTHPCGQLWESGLPQGHPRPFHCALQEALAPKTKQTCPGHLPPWRWLRAQMVHGTGRFAWPSLAVRKPLPPNPPLPPKTNTKLQIRGRHILSVVAENRPGAGGRGERREPAARVRMCGTHVCVDAHAGADVPVSRPKAFWRQNSFLSGHLGLFC